MQQYAFPNFQLLHRAYVWSLVGPRSRSNAASLRLSTTLPQEAGKTHPLQLFLLCTQIAVRGDNRVL
jgi:hypothetical protein